MCWSNPKSAVSPISGAIRLSSFSYTYFDASFLVICPTLIGKVKNYPMKLDIDHHHQSDIKRLYLFKSSLYY